MIGPHRPDGFELFRDVARLCGIAPRSVPVAVGPEKPWAEPLDRLLRELGATPAGLTASEASSRLARYGTNDVARAPRRPAWLRFVGRFTNPLVIILLCASGLSAATGDVTSLLLVVAIILISVVLDVVQELRAEDAVDALRRTIALNAAVRRDGSEKPVEFAGVVPGDVVRLAAGDLVPADCRLLDSKDLFVNQALLTGEAYPVEKRVCDLVQDCDAGDAANTVLMGSSVISGSGVALVCRTGHATAFGHVATALAERAPPTAFESGIRRFGLLILRMTVFLVLFVIVVNIALHRPVLESVMFALALAVGLTPELLPMVTTVTLARGAVRLARRKVVVKRLAAMHNLGAMDVLCTDKTGTLTEARISLVRAVSGDGGDSQRVFELAYVNSAFETGIKSPLDDAILEHGQPDMAGWHKLDEVPFDFERRRVSVLAASGERHLLIVKGAPEEMVRLSTAMELASGTRSPLDEDGKRALLERIRGFNAEGFRVIAVAYREIDRDRVAVVQGDEADLIFAGFAVFLDPPKRSAGEAIRALGNDGIQVKILTGDSEEVTRHACAEIGLPVRGVISGTQLTEMGPEALLASVSQVDIFCRVTPQQKHRIVLALHTRGQVVGFMGDGINDAPAIHAADVGISVDSGADVAKEAADVILLEHDLGVLHAGVLEGRRSVVNVTKYILMGTSSNFGNMFSMAGAALFLPFLPMQPIQVLLNNLLYDASETALPFDHVDEEEIAAPVRWDLGLIERFMLIIGPLSSLFDFLTFYVLFSVLGFGEAAFQSGWFVESLTTQILVVFVIRTRRRFFRSLPHPALAILSLGLVGLGALLPFSALAGLLGFVPLPASYFVFLGVAAFAYLCMVEAVKNVFYRRLAKLRASRMLVPRRA
jgi:Mg2+-importing ATPase